MAYYHCSPTAGLTVLEPRKPESFEKPARVYMTTLLPMALMYTVRNYEYSYGYTKEGQYSWYKAQSNKSHNGGRPFWLPLFF